MVPFATPSASPRPPSVNDKVTVSPEIVAMERDVHRNAVFELNDPVGSLPAGSCNVTSRCCLAKPGQVIADRAGERYRTGGKLAARD